MDGFISLRTGYPSPKPIQHSRAKIVYHHIADGNGPFDKLERFRVLQVRGYAHLVQIEVVEGCRLVDALHGLAAATAGTAAAIQTLVTLHLYYLGAHKGQQESSVGASARPGEIGYPNALQS